VVVATKDRPAMLRECLESILRGAIKPERLVVVDNASASSETAELVSELQSRNSAFTMFVKTGLALPGRTTRPCRT
jgi:glycosyltransferase involved in cell wall biosynthesis